MIAIYALLALGGVVALVGWWEYHNYQIRAAERAKWQAAMDVCRIEEMSSISCTSLWVVSGPA